MRLAAALGLALLAATSLPAEERPALRDYLPKAVAECGASPDWVELSPGEEVTLKPPQGADYEKVDCLLKRLQGWSGLKLGFIGNEVDPDQRMDEPWSYIAGGRISDLRRLAREAAKAGWIVGKLAKADDGTGFLLFRSPDAATYAEAEAFSTRLSRHEFGDIVYGAAPAPEGDRSREP